MTGTAVAAHVTATRGQLRKVLIALCVTEITSWGVLYYAFLVLAPQISDDTGWTIIWVTAAFSASQLAAAIAGIPVGRWLDRHGPRAVMTAGSLLGAGSLLLISIAPGLCWFIAGWLGAGVAMGAVLYPPACAALTRWYGDRRVGALTVLTLVAGLASTIFAPLTAALSGALGWRATYMVLAVVLATITVPLHWWGLRVSWPEPAPSGESERGGHPTRIARSGPFLALTLALTLGGFVGVATVVNMVPLLTERGASPTLAAAGLGLGGAGQVLGRLGYASMTKRIGARTQIMLILAAVGATTALLGMLTTVGLLVVAAIGAGMARGVFTLLQATAVSDRWGTRHYGRLTGLLFAPLTVAAATAPWAGAAIADSLGSYSALFVLLAALGGAAAVLGALTMPSSTRPSGTLTS